MTFVERPAELAALHQALREAPVATLVGPPGAGKSRLAREAAGRAPVPATFRCHLAAAVSTGELLDAVASTLRVTLSVGVDVDAVEHLGEALASAGPCWIILDDADAVAAQVAGMVSAWCVQAPEARFVITSREALRIDPERRVDVGPLDVEAARRLFVARASAVEPRFELGADQIERLDAMLARVDRLPLAIELTAAQARLFSLEEIDRRLAARTLPQAPPRRDADPRHHSIDSAIAWSWQLLTEEEQSILGQLSVFAGGFTLDAAEAVVRVPGAVPLLDGLHRLRDKSLVTRHDDGERLAVLESLRSFALRDLEAFGELEPVFARHADWFLARAGEWSAEASGPEAAQALRRLTEESWNLTAVLHRFRERDPSRAGRAVAALLEAVLLRGGYEEHARLIREVIPSITDPGLVAHLRTDLVLVLGLAGRYHEARAVAEETEVEVPQLVARLSWVHALMLQALEDEARAGEELDAALETFRECRDGRGEAATLWHIGCHHWRGERFDPARTAFERALRLDRGASRVRGEARSSDFYALLLMEVGEHDAARAMLTRAIAVHEELGEHGFARRARLGLTLIALYERDWGTARRLAEEGVATARRAGDRWSLAAVLCCLAAAHACAGDPGGAEAAEAVLAEAVGRVEGVGGAFVSACFNTAQALLDLRRARDAVARGDHEAAARAWARAREPLAHPERDGTAEFPRRLPLHVLDAALRDAEPELGALHRGAAATTILTVGPGAAWFAVDDGERVHLKRRASLRGIFAALVERHQRAPDDGLTRDELREAGWPGEVLRPDSAAKRVYVALWTLRRLGLRRVLVTNEVGYALSGEVRVAVERGA